MKAWKMFFLFKWVIFRFHVSFLGCIQYSMSPGNNFLAEIVNGFASDDSFSFESWSIFGTFVVIFAGVM